MIKNRWQHLITFSLILVIILIVQLPVNAAEPCKMVSTGRISSVDQAKCLLRQPKIFGNVGNTLTTLPSPFDKLLTQRTIDLDKATFRKYLEAKGIKEADIGGSLDNPVSRTNNNASNAELARYFIIHDTSTPNFKNAPFPDNINDSSWDGNDLTRSQTGKKYAHVFINRLGDSVTVVDFKQPWRSTRYESKACGIKCKGLFLGIELIQPRRCKPRQGQTKCSGTFNDAIAPDPGFTKAQLDRLALVYIAASVRRGKWLIPAFHVVIDIGVGTHDDPQNFSLDQWSKQLDDILTQIRS